MNQITEYNQLDTSSELQDECPPIPEVAMSPTDYVSETHFKVVQDFTKNLLAKKKDKNQEAYYVSTTYLEPRAIPLTAPSANRFLTKFHKCLLERLAGSKKYHQAWFTDIEPEFHAFLDVPGSKPKDYKHPTLPKHESTIHHHGIMLCHQRHVPLMDELCEKTNADLFSKRIRGICRLRTLNVQRIRPTPEDMNRVVKYATWHASRFFGPDRPDRWEECYLVFPQSRSEFKKG